MKNLIKKYADKKLLKFLLVGVVNTLIGSGIMFLLYNLSSAGYWVSSAVNYTAGGILSYFLNKHFTFKNKDRSRKQILVFILNTVVCYALAYGLAKPAAMYLLKAYSVKIRENAGLFAGMCLYTVLGYLGQRIFVFGEEEQS